jgi:hypothetical protein
MKSRSSFNKRHRRGRSYEYLLGFSLSMLILAIILPLFQASIHAATRAGRPYWVGILGAVILIGVFVAFVVLSWVLFRLFILLYRRSLSKESTAPPNRITSIVLAIVAIVLSGVLCKNLLFYFMGLLR